MRSVVADTHAVLWFLFDDTRLASAAADALASAQRIMLPGICLVEITYLVEKGRLHDAVLPRLIDELENPASTLEIAALDLGVVLAMQEIPRLVVPDMPDRVIAATAHYYRFPLVTRDRRIRASGITTIW
jgi:PIN domain nuclease of toxin-antitoxin system